MIYFIAKPDRSAIKIGTTIRLTERLKRLVTEHGEGLEVLAVVDGDRRVEKDLHERFGHLNVVNEWFEPGDDLMGFIVAEGKPWDGEDEADTVKLTLSLPADLAKRFGVHAEMAGLSKSDLFAELVKAGCRRWVVSDRQAREGEVTPPGPVEGEAA